jgi:hypothetical protein
MGPRCPPHWTFAARAAYFGDRMCPFCDHRNPAGARFCNDCASPLQLKPCKQCDAVNDQAATNCYNCGAAYPALIGTPDATPVSPAADPAPVAATPGDVAATTNVTQPVFAATSALREGWRLLRTGEFLLAAIPTILIAGAYAAYRFNAATPDALKVASQPIAAPEQTAPTATPAVPVTVESKAVEPEIAAAVEAPIPAINRDAAARASAGESPVPPPATKRASVHRPPAPVPATKSASAHQRAVPVPATKSANAHQRAVPVPATRSASAHQRVVPARQSPLGATRPVAYSLGAARTDARVAETGKPLRPHPWQLMHVSLARCGGDLVARMVCEHRVRRDFCQGHWGEAPECASGVANEHGQ